MKAELLSTTERYSSLIDNPRIKRAQLKCDAVVSRREPAAERLATATYTVAARQAEHDASLAGDSNTDPFATADLLEAARKAWAVALDAGPAIEEAVARAEVHLQLETSYAHQPLADDAVTKLLAITALNDELVTKQAEALPDFHEVMAQYIYARANGAHGPNPDYLIVGSPSRTRPGDSTWAMPTRNEMIARFAAAAGRFKGVDASGTIKS